MEAFSFHWCDDGDCAARGGGYLTWITSGGGGRDEIKPEDATFDDYIEAIETCLAARGDALSAACDWLDAIEREHSDYRGRAAAGEGTVYNIARCYRNEAAKEV